MATTQKSRRNGSKSDMNGRQRNVLAALAARAHADAGWDILKAACEQRFAEMGKTREQVLADLLTEYRNRRKS